jgi:hypothetical protein
MKGFVRFAVALALSCIPVCALAQNIGGGMQGAGSAAMGVAKQAGQGVAGQVMQNMGMMSASASPSAGTSPEATASSAAAGSPVAAGSPAAPAAQIPAAVPVPKIPAAVPSIPGY